MRNDSIKRCQNINSLKEIEQQYTSLYAKIQNMDTIIYKQCLLYPLEIRYNQSFISEVIQTVESFKEITPKPSEKLIEYSTTYIPLLKQYQKYNQDLIDFFKAKATQIKMTNGVISEAHKEKFENELKRLPYHNDCYKKKDIPPYKSIIYLDEAIDKFLAILKKNGNVEKDLNELFNSLIPKNHQ